MRSAKAFTLYVPLLVLGSALWAAALAGVPVAPTAASAPAAPKANPAPLLAPNLMIQEKVGPQNRAFGRRPVPDEVSRKRHMLSDAIHGKKLAAHHKAMAQVKLPASFDCRTVWKLPGIDDQGQCGDCYWWSARRAVITANIVAGVVDVGTIGTSIKGSVQHGLDYHPEQGGCKGGDEYECASLSLSEGTPTPNNYPGNGQSPGGKRPVTGTLMKVKSIMFCTVGAGPNSPLNVQDVKNCLMKWGPVSFAAAASDWGDGTGVITSKDDQVNHAITIYAWDDSKGPHGAFLVMNQWSEQWGNQGFMWLGWDQNGVVACGACEGFVCVVDSVAATVPNVVGDTLGDAKAALTSAGFTVGKITGDQAGKVTGQSPAAGTQAAPGTVIDLVFSAAPQPQPTGGTPPYKLYEGNVPDLVRVGAKDGYASLLAAESDAKNIAAADKVPVLVYDSAKPSALIETVLPVSPTGPVTITLTPEQVRQVLDAAGAVTLDELLKILKDRLKAKPMTSPSPLPDDPPQCKCDPVCSCMGCQGSRPCCQAKPVDRSPRTTPDGLRWTWSNANARWEPDPVPGYRIYYQDGAWWREPVVQAAPQYFRPLMQSFGGMACRGGGG